jgi:hypothetical protein
MDPVITELGAGSILWDDSMLILLEFFVPYNNIYFCSYRMCAELTYLLLGNQMQVCTCTGQVTAAGQSHLFLLGSLVCKLYTFTAADYKT